jgi:hypothetical protein
MISALLIDKTGAVNTIRLKDINENDLYKKCGFKNNKDFELRHTWCTCINRVTIHVSLYAKNKSKTANFENKYEFPPPVDKELYFGTCILISYIYQSKAEDSPKTYVPLTPDIWKSMYNTLYGGFENLADTEALDEAEPDELAFMKKSQLTKTGYLKDGFVVDDDYAEDLSDIESEVSSLGGESEDIPMSLSIKSTPSRKPKVVVSKIPSGLVRNPPIGNEELKLEDFV